MTATANLGLGFCRHQQPSHSAIQMGLKAVNKFRNLCFIKSLYFAKYDDNDDTKLIDLFIL